MSMKLSSPEKHILLLDKFGGADFSSNPTQVNSSRSPDMQNLIADSRFFPVKRPGWKTLCRGEGAVYGLHRFIREDGNAELLCHIGSGLYRLSRDESALSLIFDGMNEGKSASFMADGALYLLDGQCYRRYDGEAVAAVAEGETTVPVTLSRASPDGRGTAGEGGNLLNPERVNRFFGDGTSVYFKLDAENLDGAPVTATVDGVSYAENSRFTVNRAAGSVTFTSAPPLSPFAENVTVAFAKTIPGGVEKINRCRLCGLFGGDSGTRVFLSGNPAYKNADWRSGASDPLYFPESGESALGSDASAVAGYLQQFDTQIILKEPDGGDATQFLRTESAGGFPVSQGAAGVGALSGSAMALLEDVPLFLTRQGVYAVSGTSVAGQRTLRCRSALINRRLLAEENLSSAVMAEHEGKCYLCVNSHCYVADSRQTFTENAAAQYEWYYWDNIPASCLLSLSGRLYFGAADGRVCRFLAPAEENAWSDDGEPVVAYWTTPYLSFGRWDRYKTVQDVHVVPLPYTRSSLKLYYSTEEIMKSRILEENIDLFSFEDLDFSRFTFRSIQAPVPFAAGQKARNAMLFQAAVQNDAPNEAFGFLAIQISYTIGGKVK